MSKVVTLEELKKHNGKDSLYILIHGKGQFMTANQMVRLRVLIGLVQFTTLRNSLMRFVVQLCLLIHFLLPGLMWQHPGGDEVVLAEAGT